jgi:uncharacterized Zn-binding protein involved in type VI secretion
MTDRPGCAATRQVIPELSAGVAPAEERAKALRHLAGCGRCHRELEAQTALIDELLWLVPERQPPAGFEASVLAPLLHRRRPQRLRTAILLAASALLIAGLAAGAVWKQAESDRQLADSYRKTLAVAHGKYLRTVPVNGDGAAPAGYVFAYQGSPAWLFVTMTAARQPGSYQMTLTTRDGRKVTLGSMAVQDDRGAWGTTVPVAVHDILVMRFTGPADHELLARFS